MNHPDIEQIRALRQENIGRLLLRAHRAWTDRTAELGLLHGYEALSMAHAMTIAHLDIEGTRLTILAERLQITKQSVGQLVAELEAKGLVERATDSVDRRAVIVTFTETGCQFLRDAYEIKVQIEAEYTALLGEEQFALLKSLLTMLIDHDPEP